MAKIQKARSPKSELQRLRNRLAEAEETIAAIREGAVDAIAVDGPAGRQIFTLQSAEQPYRILAEQMNEGAASIGADGVILFCNRRLAAMVGRPPERLVGSPAIELAAEADRKTFQQLLLRAHKGEARGEVHFQGKDGSIVPVLASLKMIAGGQTPGLCLVATDVQELKRAESELQQAHKGARRLASIVTYSNDAIIGKNLEGIVTSWNPSAEAIYGYSAEDMIGKSMETTILPDRIEEFRRLMRRVGQGESVRYFECQRVRKDGQVIDVSLSLSPLKDESGKIVGVSSIVRDITERKRAEAAVVRERQRLESVLDRLPVMVCLLTPTYDVAFANQAFRKQFGESQGRKCFEYCFGRSTPCEFCETFEVLKTNAPHDWEVTTPNGHRIHAFDFPFTDSDSSPLILEMDVDVTEQRLAEDSLRKASLYARSLIEASLDPLVTIDKDGRITDVNEATENATGVPRKRLIGSDFSNYFTVPEKADQGYRTVFAEGFVRDYPLAIRHTSGKVMDVLYNASLFKNENGEVEGVFAAARDVTERKRAEEQLRRASLYARSLIEASLDPLVTISKDGMITDVNEATETATGRGRDSLIGSDFSNYFTEPEKARQGYRSVFAEGSVRDYPLALRHVSGSVIHVLYNATLFRNEKGAVEGVFAAARDVTRRKQAEEELRSVNQELEKRVEARTSELRESESRTRRKLDSILSPEGDLANLEVSDILDIAAVQTLAEDFYKLTNIPLFMVDLKGKILVGGGWQEICTKFHRAHPESCKNCLESDLVLSTGVKPGEFKLYKCKNNMWDAVTPLMLGEKHIANIFTGQFFFSDEPVDYELFRSQARQYGFDEQSYMAALARVPRLGREQVEISRAFFTKFAQLLSQLSYSGIKLARSMEETRNANFQLTASNKELEAFTYSVSHDLRAPLRHILGFSKILTEEFAPQLPEEAQHHLQRIEEGTRRMGQLVDDLLNLARVGRRDIALQVTGLKSVVQEVITSLGPDIGDRQVEWKIGDLPYVECDSALMKQVFQNLLANALKFTRPRPKTVIEVGQAEKDGVPVVYVRDNGVGFSMKYADKLFGVFQRLHRSEDFEGTGVGLATVQRIIQKHGGRIWAEAELDKGATFYFTLGSAEHSELKAETAVAGANS
ncbi:MAG TPA: PAS domain S-box protein [Terriglobales bacterium]